VKTRLGTACFSLPLILSGFVVASFAQVPAYKIQEALGSKEEMSAITVTRQNLINQVYLATGYTAIWTWRSAWSTRTTFIRLLNHATGEGLDKEDYQLEFFNAFTELELASGHLADSLDAELRFTDAAIHFFTDLAYGNRFPTFGYDGLKFIPVSYDIPRLVAAHAMADQLDALFIRLANSSPDANAIRNKLRLLNELKNKQDYREEKIVSTKVSHLNKPLIRKLYFLGVGDSVSKLSDIGIRKSLIEAQKEFDLLADGVLRSTALAALNIPLGTRLRQLSLAINYYRWLNCLARKERVVVVNIPAAYLKVYDRDAILLEMRMIVGKPSTPTPTLTSRITEVILYPYWYVPHSIATKELLPAIKRNTGYVDANNIQVISKSGRRINPYKINWQEVSAADFPYTLRQATGCDNSLGLLKLNFYNPVGVYLHDTPSKPLFLLNKRYFSHGCMRMEKPVELGHLVLKDNAIAIDTLTEKGCLRNQSPVIVAADEKLAVVVWYNPVSVDKTGRVVFYEDIYRKFN
jgi:murein L,D-transpeptidase YcbB/YkuD